MSTNPNILIPTDRLEDFCRKWKITELALFGSAVRDDFGPESDVDVLVTFEPDAPWSLLDLVQVKLDLEEVFGRPVDIIERPALEKHHNPWLRSSILGSVRQLYKAPAA